MPECFGIPLIGEAYDEIPLGPENCDRELTHAFWYLLGTVGLRLRTGLKTFELALALIKSGDFQFPTLSTAFLGQDDSERLGTATVRGKTDRCGNNVSLGASLAG